MSNELNAPADIPLTAAKKTQKKFKDIYNNISIIEELALFRVDYTRAYNSYNERQKFSINSAINKILGNNIEKDSDNINIDDMRFAALKKLNINEAHVATFEQFLTDEERCLLLSATQSLGNSTNSAFLAILHEAGLDSGKMYKKAEEDRKTEITDDGFIWTISKNYTLINTNNDNKQILGKYKIIVEVKVTKENNITKKTIKKISYVNEFLD